MASAVKKCRVCGRQYEACRSADRASGVFRWQEVACSPECGAKYLAAIQKSREKEAPRSFGAVKKAAARTAGKKARSQTAETAHTAAAEAAEDMAAEHMGKETE